eukprot:GEZU01040668.1.p1 GENE.GEZU01040668.1~~GEZU01040668.1.p1  ORF type:complete len:112 (+),score=22.64 GEZU01040668.1:3-338(+)
MVSWRRKPSGCKLRANLSCSSLSEGEFSDSEVPLRDWIQQQQYWTNLAKYGDVMGSGDAAGDNNLFQWLPYNQGSEFSSIQLAQQPSLEDDTDFDPNHRCEFWSRLNIYVQ